jgi:hypothetical protein
VFNIKDSLMFLVHGNFPFFSIFRKLLLISFSNFLLSRKTWNFTFLFSCFGNEERKEFLQNNLKQIFIDSDAWIRRACNVIYISLELPSNLNNPKSTFHFIRIKKLFLYSHFTFSYRISQKEKKAKFFSIANCFQFNSSMLTALLLPFTLLISHSILSLFFHSFFHFLYFFVSCWNLILCQINSMCVYCFQVSTKNIYWNEEKHKACMHI